MLSPEIQSLFGIQRPRGRFSSYWEKNLRLEQRNPINGKAKRDKSNGKLRNTRNAEGVEQRCCCKTGNCPCQMSGGGEGTLNGSTITLHTSGIVVPTTCLRFVLGNEFQLAAASASWKIISAPVNGTFCLTQVGDSCVYQTNVTGEVIANFSIGSEATGDFAPACCDCFGYGGLCEQFTFTNIIIQVTMFFDGTKTYPQVRIMLDEATGVTPSPSPFSHLLGAAIGIEDFFYNLVNFATTPTLTCGSSAIISNQAGYYYAMFNGDGLICADATNSFPADFCNTVLTDLFPSGKCCGSDPPFVESPFSNCPSPAQVPYNGTAQVYDAAC